MDTVYYDAGDILVTNRRVAVGGVSEPLADVTGARVERVDERQTVIGRRTAGRSVVVVPPLVAAIVWLFVMLRPPPAVAAPSPWTTVLLVGLTAAGVAAGALLLIATGQPVVKRRVARWHAVRLTVRGRAVELFRTRDAGWAAAVVAAIDRARADAGGGP